MPTRSSHAVVGLPPPHYHHDKQACPFLVFHCQSFVFTASFAKVHWSALCFSDVMEARRGTIVYYCSGPTCLHYIDPRVSKSLFKSSQLPSEVRLLDPPGLLSARFSDTTVHPPFGPTTSHKKKQPSGFRLIQLWRIQRSAQKFRRLSGATTSRRTKLRLCPLPASGQTPSFPTFYF